MPPWYRPQRSPLVTATLLFGTALAAIAAAGCSRSVPDAPPAIEASVMFAPIPVESDRAVTVAYEIVFASDFRALGYELVTVEVLDQGGQLVARYDEHDVDANLLLPKAPLPTAEELEFTGKLSTPILLLWLELNKAAAVPDALSHRLYFQLAGGADPFLLEGVPTAVHKVDPVVIAPPLHGVGWLALETNGAHTHHAQGMITVDGVTRVPQRHAVDWLRLSAAGQLWEGAGTLEEGTVNTDFPGYGAELLAVADGTVLDVVDGLAEKVGWSWEATPPEELAGNHIVLDLGDGHYALYAHCIPGSIGVAVGDSVEAGDVLAQLGNSGNSNAPHLHFHICDAPSALACQGVPYRIDAFQIQGYVDLDDIIEQHGAFVADGPPRSVAEQIPDDNAVIAFP